MKSMGVIYTSAEDRALNIWYSNICEQNFSEDSFVDVVFYKLVLLMPFS